MTLNPHLTDQLLAKISESRHVPGCIVAESVQPLVERLMQQLPGADPQQLGEFCMHIARSTADLSLLMHRRGIPAELIGHDVAITLGEAGARLYRGGA
ncbi:MAG TPA: hypothetical protein VGD91_19420 [Trebonia sp.]